MSDDALIRILAFIIPIIGVIFWPTKKAPRHQALTAVMGWSGDATRTIIKNNPHIWRSF